MTIPAWLSFGDKVGLGHNGQRLPQGGHIVMLLDEERKYVPAHDWDLFIEAQRKLLAAQKNGTEFTINATTRISGEEVKVQLRVLDGSLYGRVWRGGRMSSGMTLANMDREPEIGIVGIPILTTTEIKNTKIEVENQTGYVRFTMKDHQILFDGEHFTFEHPWGRHSHMGSVPSLSTFE